MKNNGTTFVLVAINARYSHASHALRCLAANLGAFRSQTTLLETTLEERPLVLAERILALSPKVVGFSVAIWNVEQSVKTMEILRLIAPDVCIIAGGPAMAGVQSLLCADVVVDGEAEKILPKILEDLQTEKPVEPLYRPQPVDLATVQLPYDEYTQEDLRQRLVSVESSRGCRQHCSYCQSASGGLRLVPLDRFFAAMEQLLARNLSEFRMLDRSLDASPERALAILDFFLNRLPKDGRLHVELTPGALLPELLAKIQAFPVGMLHLELGVQSFNPSVLATIRRRGNPDAVERDLRFLVTETGAEIHADLIAGLPGESWESFAAGFDRLYRIGPDHIQLGILKLLSGAPLAEEIAEHHLVFSPHPPYDLLASPLLSFTDMQRLRRLARYYDLFVNAGRFPKTCRLLLEGDSPFAAWTAFGDWLWKHEGREHSISLPRQEILLGQYLTIPQAKDALKEDALWRERPRKCC